MDRNVSPNDKPQADALVAYLDRVPMKDLLGLPQRDLDSAMATAFQMYQAGRLDEAEILCRGLIAADPGYWWCYSLYAAVARKQGRLRQAIALFDAGLRHEPHQPKLLAMRAETMLLIDALAATAEASKIPSGNGKNNVHAASSARAEVL